MRIQVKDGENNIHIAFPTWLLCNRFTAKSGIWVLQRYVPSELHDLSPEKLSALFAELRRIKAKYGRWELVDVHSADGEIIKVIL